MLTVCLFAVFLCSCAAEVPEVIRRTTVHIADYTIVRGDEANNEVLKQALNIRSSICLKYNRNVISSTDWDADAEGANENYEILVGVTNRPESRRAYEELQGKQGYILRSDGNKIVIAATSKNQLEKAVNIFVFNYLDNAPEGYLPKEFEEVSEASERMLLLNEGNEISMVLPENASKLLIRATQTFSDSFAEQYGICIKNELIGKEGEIILGQPEEKSALQNAQDLSEEMYLVQGMKGALRICAKDDLRLVAGLNAVFEVLPNTVDYTLNEEPLLWYDRFETLSGIWEWSFPSPVGCRYLGEESISSSAEVSHYENMSPENFQNWSCMLSSDGYSTVSYDLDGGVSLSHAQKGSLYVFYDRTKRILKVMEM